MTESCFTFPHQFIHIADNNKWKKKAVEGCDGLFKVRCVLDEIMKGWHCAWVACEKVTIDKSMIWCIGCTIEFVQYMPCISIKHRIKVFAICCSVTAVLFESEVYTGKDTGTAATAIAIVERLIVQSKLTSARRRTLYTDNWYTSVKLAKVLFERYGWWFCGTVVPTNKHSCQDEDVPFQKLSKGALRSIPCWWYWEAVLQWKFRHKKYYVQATTWKDCKQLMLLQATNIRSSRGLHNVRRSKRKRNGWEVFPWTLAQEDYAKNYAVVDQNSHDSADCSTSMRTNQFYFCILFLLFERVVCDLLYSGKRRTRS